ncbi:MAG: molybdopterin-dependent oxidoreductase [Granulosicoccus sp.]
MFDGNVTVIKATLVFLFVIVQLVPTSHAQSLDEPTGPVILTISGSIDVYNSQNDLTENTDSPMTARFDLAMLENIGLTQVTTETPWTKGLMTFEGVLARDLMKGVMARGNSVRASAFDNYSVDIPIEDFQNYDVIVATRINGKIMRVRDNGPLWVIYPWTDKPELKRPYFFARSIWQLHSIVVNP